MTQFVCHTPEGAEDTMTYARAHGYRLVAYGFEGAYLVLHFQSN